MKVKARTLINALPGELGKDEYKNFFIEIQFLYNILRFSYKNGHLLIQTNIRCEDYWYEEAQYRDYWSITTNYESLANLYIFSNNPETEIKISFDENEEKVIFIGDEEDVVINVLGKNFFNFNISSFESLPKFCVERRHWQLFHALAYIIKKNSSNINRLNTSSGIYVYRFNNLFHLNVICSSLFASGCFFAKSNGTYADPTIDNDFAYFTLSIELIDAVAKLNPLYSYLKINEDRVLIETDSTMIISPLLDRDVTIILPDFLHTDEFKVKKQDFVNAIQQASGKVTIKTPNANQVLLILNNDQLIIQGINGSFSIHTDFNYSNYTNDSSICICAVALLDLLKGTLHQENIKTEYLYLRLSQQIHGGLQIQEGFAGICYYFLGVIKTDRVPAVTPSELQRKFIYKTTPEYYSKHFQFIEIVEVIVEIIEESPLELHTSQSILEKIKIEREEMGVDNYIQLVDEVLVTQADVLLVLKNVVTANLSPEQQAELIVAKAQLEETLEISKEVQEAVESGYGYDGYFYEDDLRELVFQLRLKGGRVLEIVLDLQKTWKLQLRL